MKQPTYAQALAWIANNDESACLDAAEMAQLISVVLVADLWGQTPEQVAETVVRARRAAQSRERAWDAETRRRVAQSEGGGA